MKKFTSVSENATNLQNYLITANIELLIRAANEGEASYIADSTLSGVDDQYSYSISTIEISDKTPILESVESTLNNLAKDTSAKDKINKAWEIEFDGKNPTYLQKMEFYYQLRKCGFDGETIFSTLGKKI